MNLPKVKFNKNYLKEEKILEKNMKVELQKYEGEITLKEKRMSNIKQNCTL